MKSYRQLIFLTVLTLILSGCSVGPKPNKSAQIDETLPIVQLTKSGTFVDMKAVGFEWNLIEDPRVKGIYVYKQGQNAQTSEHDFYKTIQSRFVTHFIDEDVEPGSKYSYFFKTFSNVAESKPTVAFEVNTLPPLESVSWIHANQNMPRSAKIIWRPHINQIVKSYIIERKTLESDEWEELTVIRGRLNVEYIDTNLKDSFVYKYRIRVLTYNDIVSAPSAEVKIITKALPRPVAKITATKNLPKQIRLTWNKTDIKDFSHYNIYRADSDDGSYKLIKQTKATAFVDQIQDNGEDKFYKVSVVDLDDLESKYDEVIAHGRSLQNPETPSLVEVKMVGDNLEIRWATSDPRVKTYVVKKTARKGLFDVKHEEFLDIKGNVFVDTLIEPSTTYSYKVYSVDEFFIKSEPSIEVNYATNENEGKIIEKAELIDEVKGAKETKIQENGSVMVIKPLEDIDMSVR